MKLTKFERRSHIQQEEEVDTEGVWAVSYGDMVTLLLSFFILFFTINPNDNTSKKQALKLSLLEQLKQGSGDTTGNNVKGDPSMSLSQTQKNEFGMDPEILKSWKGMAFDKGNHVIVDFPGVSFFKSGQVQLTYEGEKALAQFIKLYMPYAGHYQVGIRAFTDTKPVKAFKHRAFKDNLELSALRSIAAMRSLQKAGLPLNKMKIGGYGEMLVTRDELKAQAARNRVVASISNEFSLSRRIVLVIEPEEK